MVKYRRYHQPGSTYFFTLVLQDRKSNWLTKYIKQLGDAMRDVKQIHPFDVVAMVVLQNHLHAMWELPEEDDDYSLRWRCIKKRFAMNIKKMGIKIEKNRFGENRLWQRRFWEHTVRDEKDFARHVDYIHYNPVKHGLVNCVKRWPFSTFHRYVKKGLLPVNWCYVNDDLDVE